MAASRGAASRRACAPPPVTPRARPAAAPALPQRARVRPPRAAPGSLAGGLVTCPRRSPDSSGGEDSFPNIRGIKKSLPQLSSSANRLSKNISSTTEKTVHQTLENDQPSDFFKKGNRVNKSHQKSSNMNAGPPWTKVQRSKHSSGKRQSASQVPHVSPPPEDGPRESSSLQGDPERSPLGPRRRGVPSGDRLFLELQCRKVRKEAAAEDEDSASDLSDSERVPMPPAARAPPELQLRAEQIDEAAGPGLDPDSEPWAAPPPAYGYADFLPAPFSSWDLRDLAAPPGTEPSPAARGGAAGLLARYIDRLVQLEWLQMQTVQGEKGKGARARPPTGPGATSGALKSPGRAKLVVSAAARLPQDVAGKPPAPRRKDLSHEEARPSYYAFDRPPRAPHARGSRPSSQRPALEARTEEQTKKASKSPRPQQGWHAPCGDRGDPSSPGAPLRGASAADPTDPRAAPRMQAHTALKKKGAASTWAPATTSREKKPKTNGAKPSTYKLK
ncbi:protein FAM217B isoform X1 [Vulpes vulpes]|uniref:Protein FAM217B isoform X1 n=2 Tax=Vulpes vulpes TaxID=9627 RepID=A0ABM4YMP8_VULVU